MDAARQSIHAVVAAFARGEISGRSPITVCATCRNARPVSFTPLELGLGANTQVLPSELEPVQFRADAPIAHSTGCERRVGGLAGELAPAEAVALLTGLRDRWPQGPPSRRCVA